jgi:predicted metalloprotease
MWQLLAAEAVKKKMEKSNSTASTGIPGWAKGVIIIIIIVVVLFIAYKIYKKVSDVQMGSDKEDVKDTQQELNALIQGGTRPSYGQSQFSQWASTLRQSFDGCGTDNKVWENVFKSMRNKADVLALIATYGVRTYDGCNWEGDFNDKTGGLTAALNDELSSSEISKINTMLSNKNITFQF